MTRKQIAHKLLTGCPEEMLADHEKIAAAILRGDSLEQILGMRETNDWPDTYVWLKAELPITYAAGLIGSHKSPKKSEASAANGKKGGRPGMYSVERVDMDCTTTVLDCDLSRKTAEALASKYSDQYPDDQIYISWFRKSDHQHGYLNPDGNHDITGRPW